jgi:hypothetical protein
VPSDWESVTGAAGALCEWVDADAVRAAAVATAAVHLQDLVRPRHAVSSASRDPTEDRACEKYRSANLARPPDQ